MGTSEYKATSNITDQYIIKKHYVWDIATPKRCRKVESNPKIVTDLMLSASFGGVTTMNGRDDDFCLRICFQWILDHTFFGGIKLPRPPKGCFGPVKQRDLRFACKCYVWNDIPITDTWSWPFKVAVSELRVYVQLVRKKTRKMMIYTYTVALGIPYLQTDPAQRRIFLDVVPCFWASKSRLVEPTNVAHLVYMLRGLMSLDVVWKGKKANTWDPSFNQKSPWVFQHGNEVSYITNGYKWLAMRTPPLLSGSLGVHVFILQLNIFGKKTTEKRLTFLDLLVSSGFHQYFNWRCTQNTTRDPFKWPKIVFCFFNLFSWSKSLLSTSVCEIVQLRASCWGFHHFGFRADYIRHVPRGRPFD
jgi:hypothetical protein